MKDTSPAIEVKFFNMMMAKSGIERLKMGFEMYEMSRKMVIASITKDNPGITDKEMKISLLKRFYGDDLSSDTKKKFAEKIKG
ncbi:MAG: hypothetical protein MRK02_17415 [Candidatus Scalindua sp.]|nr:hypothetical protein [Candidatus Scalindua sp.]